eukprot:m.441530 g.441530  ORF g.441530 m.441530 type:complete len:51 (+) comp18669_c0_seq1:3371-3523(+)
MASWSSICGRRSTVNADGSCSSSPSAPGALHSSIALKSPLDIPNYHLKLQ